MSSGKFLSIILFAFIMVVAIENSQAQYIYGGYGFYYPSYYYVLGKRGAGFYEHPQTLPATDRQGNNIRVQPRPYSPDLYEQTSNNNRAYP
uniref:Uncharacterized protein n=2 Tax=Panagrolaimus sp. PS1159 TaxID=55785 RepID=A0AC35GLZ7_9BILA